MFSQFVGQKNERFQKKSLITENGLFFKIFMYVLE